MGVLLFGRLSFALVALPLVAACSDPLSGVERLSDVDLAEGASAAAVAPDASELAEGSDVLSQAIDGTLTAGPDVLPGQTTPDVVVTASAPATGGILGQAEDGGVSECRRPRANRP